MVDPSYSPAQSTYWLISGRTLFPIVHGVGLACFFWIVARRMLPLVRANRDPRFDHPWLRLQKVAKYWLGQWKHPRYPSAAILHILIFAGFILLATRAFSLLIFGGDADFAIPGLAPGAARIYDVVTDYASTTVLIAVMAAALRRIVFKPARYAVPASFGRRRPVDALLLLGLIALLMLADGLYAGARAALYIQQGRAVEPVAAFSLAWMLQNLLLTSPATWVRNAFLGAYLAHQLTFYFLLCYRPFGIQFHVETSLFNVFFAKLEPEIIKPVRWGVPDDQLDQVKSFGVKTFEDFTWKHMLDFYTCADCGRCSDQCPSKAAGRPLQPRFLTLKACDYAFYHYPVFKGATNGAPLVGGIYSEDEVWSCTTCGACEAECPLLVEYIDKIVDLRRGLVDEGRVPQSLQKPLKSLESRGNPYGKLEKKRADWTSLPEFRQECKVPLVNGAPKANTLYFVDSVSSFDERMQSIARATARILGHVGEEFAILGPAERDSGHEVRRFGEEMLFLALREHNTEAIRASGVTRIVTADPHAYNALKHDYRDLPPVEHISQFLSRKVRAATLEFNPVDDASRVYTYHDPCYLGRHNQVYDDPRAVLDAIPGLRRVEMKRCRDRSFCCGGGGLALFYEPKEEERMGVLRVRMAAEAGANTIVTACPFCLANLEDAIKVSGMEGKLAAIDLAELADRHIRRAAPAPAVGSEAAMPAPTISSS